MQEPIQSSQSLKHFASIQSQQKQQPRCRICLQQQGELLSLPCLCKQDLGKVHEKCFAKWVQTISPASTISSITSTKCEICMKNIKIQVKIKNRIRGCQQIHQKRRCCQFISGFIIIAVILFLIYLCISGIVNNTGKDSFVMYFVYAIIIIFLLVVLKQVIQFILRIFRIKQIASLKFLNRTDEQPQETIQKNN